ncbi:hypothetical protein [Bacillus sp. CGMCC 1.16541]|uniref:hypothetical protein n=1 Tax=Bacillus sp. CGMCC 1.16541 TaxID=2185143 RepID=UPI000D738ECC|nr:hypothetical protein [Bacillus sp. CGMCC 1.16541]
MKKLLIFLASLGVLFFLLELVVGFILTATYKPPLSEAQHVTHLASEVAFGTTNMSSVVVAMIAACFAYFLSKRVKTK